MGKHSKKRPVSARILSVVGTLIIVVALALSAFLVIPAVAGVNMFCIATQSMEPEIPVGSLVCVERVDPQDLVAGDVITYVDAQDSNVPVTHRVVENDLAEWELVTKGDANEQSDPITVSYGQVVGKVIFSIPLLGYLAVAVSTPIGKISIALLIVVGLLLCIAADRIRRRA